MNNPKRAFASKQTACKPSSPRSTIGVNAGTSNQSDSVVLVVVDVEIDGGGSVRYSEGASA